MQLQLQITIAGDVLQDDVMDVAALFSVRYITPGITLSSDGSQTNWLRMEIDGGAKLSEKAYEYLQARTYTLLFLKPPHEYTVEEMRDLDVEEEQWR